MKPLQKLDKLVKKELNCMKMPDGIKVRFRQFGSPGDGTFIVNAKINDVSIRYECEKEGVEITLRCRDEFLFISADESTVYHVTVNGQDYFEHCDDEELEPWKEYKNNDRDRLNALKHGKKCLEEVRNYFKGAAPELVKLMDNYFFRRLMPMDDLMPERSNEQVFEMFLGKLNKPRVESLEYGRAKAR